MCKRHRRMSGREVIKALGSHGFDVVRVKGSHHILKHSYGRVTVVPVHSGEVIGSGLLHKICRDVGVTLEELSH